MAVDVAGYITAEVSDDIEERSRSIKITGSPYTGYRLFHCLLALLIGTLDVFSVSLVVTNKRPPTSTPTLDCDA